MVNKEILQAINREGNRIAQTNRTNIPKNASASNNQIYAVKDRLMGEIVTNFTSYNGISVNRNTRLGKRPN
jgi:hypothetical protein